MKKHFCKIVCILIIGFGHIPHVLSAQSESYNIDYLVYAGGLKAFNTSMDIHIDQESRSYKKTTTLEPHGWINRLLPWEGTYSVEGIINSAQEYIPQLYTRHDIWRNDVTQTRIAYDKDGTVRNAERKETSADGDILSDYAHSYEATDAKGSVDLMTALLRLFIQPNDTSLSCAGEEIVFDGKRRYQIIFSKPRLKKLSKSRYNAYSGESIQCNFRLEPLNGFDDRKRGFLTLQEQASEKGKTAKLWMARLHDKSKLAAPVRIEIHSNYGAIIAHYQMHETP